MKKSKNIKVLLFDLYGTILKQDVGDLEDTTSLENEKKLLISFKKLKKLYKSKNKIKCSSKKLKKLFLKYISKFHEEKRKKGVDFPEVKIEEVWKLILKEINHPQKDDKNFWFEIADNHQRCIAERFLYNNSAEIFDYCIKNNIKLGIISNAQFYTEKDLLRLLKKTKQFKNILSIYDIFEKDLCFFSYKIGFSKPNMKIFDLVSKNLKHYNITMDETIFVGNDIFNDIYVGNKSNMKTCLVINPETKYRKNDARIENVSADKLKPDFIVKDFIELVEYFEQEKLEKLRKLSKYYSLKELKEVIVPEINHILEKRKNKFLCKSKKFITVKKNLEPETLCQKTFFVSIQGGQGTGKTTFAEFLSEFFKEMGFNSISFSLDDYYFPAKIRKQIHLQDKENPYYKISRGLPGTHDLTALKKTLELLKNNEKTRILKFNKSLLNGYGDRCSSSIIVKDIDFVFFEGYCNNLPKTNIQEFRKISLKNKISLNFDPSLKYSKKLIKEVEKYVALWNYFEYSISLREDNPDYSVKWKILQERKLKTAFSDTEVKDFVGLFQPITYLCYEKGVFDSKIFINEEHRMYKK